MSITLGGLQPGGASVAGRCLSVWLVLGSLVLEQQQRTLLVVLGAVVVAWYGRYVSKYTIGTLYWLTRLEQAWEIESCQSRITSGCCCCLQSRGGRELRKVCLSCILLLLLDGWSKLCSLTCLLSLCNSTYYVSSCLIFQISLNLATFDNCVFLLLHQLVKPNMK